MEQDLSRERQIGKQYHKKHTNWGGKHGLKQNRCTKIERTGEGTSQLYGSLYAKRIYKVK